MCSTKYLIGSLSLLILIVNCLCEKRNFSNSPCPGECVCFRRNVRCMRLELNEIPKVPLQAVLLDLRFNKIREITPGTFKGHKHIKSLLLNNNLLTSLENGIFAGLHQLRHLYLYQNRIKFIGQDVFQGLPKLEHLYLQNNEIEEFKPGTFTNMPTLDRLFLYNNYIQHIPPGSFKGLQKLTRLRLDSNSLVCDCQISWLARTLRDNSIHSTATCKYPNEMYGKPLVSLNSADFHCQAPKIMKNPEDIEISFGGTAVFTCHAEGDQPLSFIWMHDHKEVPLNDNDKYTLMDDGSLMVKNTVESDGGIYECMVKNDQTIVKSRPAMMHVVHAEAFADNTVRSEKPRFLVAPQSITTSDGAPEVRLPCQVSGNPKPLITWSKDGISISPSNRHIIGEDGSLTIRPVYGQDFGTYRCDASNQFAKITASADIIINASPVFTIHPTSISVLLGKTARFECLAVGTPSPTITWYKENQIVKTNDRIKIKNEGTLLEIHNVHESDESLYVCKATNSLGSREVSASLKLTNSNRNKAPVLIYKPYNIEAIEGTTIELPCKADGNPKPGIQWTKDGNNLQRTGRWKISLNGNLYIYKANGEDQGRYECTAINDHGRASASGYLAVKEESGQSAKIGIGDQFVKIAFIEASEEIDKAINRTIDSLFNRKGNYTSSELFRLIRYPNAPARELARGAEVYERTLINIRKHVEKGMNTKFTSNFNYKELLSPEHLELVAQLSGCTGQRYARNCSDMCFHSKYRSIDGLCNNLQNPTWGASYTGFRRLLKPIYEDGFSTPIGWDKHLKYNGYTKPSSRYISTHLIKTEKITSDKRITHMVMQWGQFLDHDLDHALPSVSSESWDGIDCKKSCDYAAPCYPIDIPPGDPRVTNRRCIDFVRTSAVCGSGMTSVFFNEIQPREQINQLTSYLDASQVYGYSEELARDIRDTSNELGRLREGTIFPGRKPLLPYAGNQGMDCRRNLSESTVNCFLAGDIRVNEQVGLIAMHTIWFREHNRVARELRKVNQQWHGDTLYYEARKVVGAAMQHITYEHWLPLILGPEGMEMLGPYKGYNPIINPSISNVFATAAFRFGHTLINPVLHRLNETFQTIPEGNLPLHKAFFSPWRIVEEGGIDPLLRGLYTIAAKLKKPDQNLNSDLTEQLFKTAHAVALDLAAMNVHRARDHAIPGYMEFRKVCNMSEVETFEDLKYEISDAKIRHKLKEIYGHVGNIDVFVGGILEDQVEGGKIGPLFRCILIDQFRRMRDGDRFWYENPSTFKPEQLTQIKQYNLGRILCDNGDNITKITNNVFLLPLVQGGYINCDEMPKVDFRLWNECCEECSIRNFNTINNRFRRHFPYETVDNPKGSALEVIDGSSTINNRIDDLEEVIDYMQKDIKRLNKLIRKLENKCN